MNRYGAGVSPANGSFVSGNKGDIKMKLRHCVINGKILNIIKFTLKLKKSDLLVRSITVI